MNPSPGHYFKHLRMKRFYSRFISRGDLCFDIGAHAGERTRALASLGARVISIEPQAYLAGALNSRFSKQPNVTVLQCAIDGYCGEATLMQCNEHSECSTLSDEFMHKYEAISGLHWTPAGKVTVRTINSLIDEFGIPKLIKLDIEGKEGAAIGALSRPVNHLHFEFNYPLLHDTVGALHHLAQADHYDINFIRYEIMRPVLPEWINAQSFIRDIHSCITPELRTGEILCRRVASDEL